MKEKAVYVIDLMTSVNYEKMMTDWFVDKIKGMKGFIGMAPWAYGQSWAALFDSADNRNKAHAQLIKEGFQCAVILETGYIPA